MTTDEQYMLRALEQAQMAANRDEVPVGVVVVCQDRIIARGHNHLTSCAKTRVDAHDSARSKGRSEEQLLQILCKHADSFFVCLLFTLRSKLRFDAGAQQSLVGIGGGSGDLRSGSCVGAHKRSGDAVGCPTIIGRSDGHA